ncbi:transmembrane-type terpene cyclase [Actinoalloteichus hymeniacidonis]|uniref:Uncharacterized protein n=1 Tax=Actinoalloteichus hymeniacidonis TaxID=340345 RepID=A0AAC9HSA6_9PSEU|nr:hypothetical protein [Actinoalloteichus hymeniacidonis]AOS64493.1 hypothetical protein TL08_18490 [Actinoalloteichus hymeniacidonis]MBB5907436.1 hypothetical protein [Actinoalloteichus hymeniacidonis]
MDLDWLPPPLFPMSEIAPVTVGPADVPDWLFWSVAGPTVLGWLITYLLAIRQTVLDGRVAIPAYLVAINVAWEFSLTFLLEQTSTQRGINLVWLVFNLVLLSLVFRYGRNDYPTLTQKAFAWSLVGVFVWAALLIMAGANEFHDRDGMYIGMILNVPLSAAFIFMLRRRGSSIGQSMYLAVAKLGGSFFAGLTGFILYPSRLLFFVIVPTMVALDILYVVLLHRRMRAEGRSPWAWRTRPHAVEEPATR